MIGRESRDHFPRTRVGGELGIRSEQTLSDEEIAEILVVEYGWSYGFDGDDDGVSVVAGATPRERLRVMAVHGGVGRNPGAVGTLVESFVECAAVGLSDCVSSWFGDDARR